MRVSADRSHVWWLVDVSVLCPPPPPPRTCSHVFMSVATVSAPAFPLPKADGGDAELDHSLESEPGVGPFRGRYRARRVPKVGTHKLSV